MPHCVVLHDAIRTGDITKVRQAFRRTSNKDITDKNGNTAFWIASEMGYLNIIRFLVNKGCATEQVNLNGWTPLHAASAAGHHTIVKYLLDHHNNPGEKSLNGSTPLMLACRQGHSKCVQMLLDASYNLDEEDNEGLSAVHHAAIGGHLAVITILEETDEDVIAINGRGHTPIVCAIQHGHTELVRYICSKVDVRTIEVFEPLGLGKNLLEVAKGCRYPEIVHMLTDQTDTKQINPSKAASLKVNHICNALLKMVNGWQT